MASRSLASHRAGSSVMQVPTGTAVTEGLANLSRSIRKNGRNSTRGRGGGYATIDDDDNDDNMDNNYDTKIGDDNNDNNTENGTEMNDIHTDAFDQPDFSPTDDDQPPIITIVSSSSSSTRDMLASNKLNSLTDPESSKRISSSSLSLGLSSLNINQADTLASSTVTITNHIIDDNDDGSGNFDTLLGPHGRSSSSSSTTKLFTNSSTPIQHTDGTLRTNTTEKHDEGTTVSSYIHNKLKSKLTASSSAYSRKDQEFDTEENEPLTKTNGTVNEPTDEYNYDKNESNSSLPFNDTIPATGINNERTNNLVRNPSYTSSSSSAVGITTTTTKVMPVTVSSNIPRSSSFSSSSSSSISLFHRPLVFFIHFLNNLWIYLGNTTYGQELQTLLPLSLPIMIQSCLNQLLNIADLFFVGTVLGPEFLAAAALGNMFFNFLSALYMGAVSAIDESCSNAYSDKQYKLVNLYAQRGFFIMTLMAILVMISMSSTEFFLTTILHQEPDLSATAAGFVQALVLGTFPYVMSIGLSRYLWAQGIVWAPIVVDILANIVNVSLNAALIEVDGFLGAPLATSLSRALQLCMLVGYMYKWKPHIEKGTWSGWQFRTILQDPKELVHMSKAAFFGSFICIIESWPIEFSNVIAGHIDVPSLDAHTVVLNTCLFISLGLPLGMSVASSARIPLLLREGNKEGARRTAIVAVLATVTYNLCCAFLLLAGRWRMGHIFTSNLEVAEQCASVATVAALFQLVDGAQSTLSGILRGLGYTRIVTVITFLGYIVIGLPMGNYLAIHYQLGTTGLWAGLLCGITSIMVCFLIIYTSIDWNHAVRSAQEEERRRQEQIQSAPSSSSSSSSSMSSSSSTDGDNGSSSDTVYFTRNGLNNTNDPRVTKDLSGSSPSSFIPSNPSPDIGGTGNGGETVGSSNNSNSSNNGTNSLNDKENYYVNNNNQVYYSNQGYSSYHHNPPNKSIPGILSSSSSSSSPLVSSTNIGNSSSNNTNYYSVSSSSSAPEISKMITTNDTSTYSNETSTNTTTDDYTTNTTIYTTSTNGNTNSSSSASLSRHRNIRNNNNGSSSSNTNGTNSISNGSSNSNESNGRQSTNWSGSMPISVR